MISLPAGYTLADLAQQDSRDPQMDALTRKWVLGDPDLQAWERQQCKASYERLARRWLTIRTPDGPRRLVFKPAQKRLHALVQSQIAKKRPVRIRVLKARQEGISTYSQGFQFHTCAIANSHVSGLTVAHDVESVQYLLSMSRVFLQELPDFLRPSVKYDTKNTIEFSDRRTDMKVATARNAKAGRTRTLVYLHLSEVAFWDHPAETTTALYQAVPMIAGTVIIEESTANGVGGYFHDGWKATQEAQDKGEETDWLNFFIPWTEEPSYRLALYEGEDKDLLKSLDLEEQQLHDKHGVSLEQLKWRRRKIAGDLRGDVERFHQEFPTHWEEAFISTGRPYFDRLVLVGWRKAVEEGPKPLPWPLTGAITRIRGEAEEVTPVMATLDVWEMPQEGVAYNIGADIAEGISPNPNNTDPDFCLADVGRIDSGDQVAELRGRWDPDVFAVLLDALGRLYNNANLAPETHGIGVAVVNALLRLGYPALYYRPSATGEALPGWETNLATKPQMLAVSKQWIRDGVGVIKSLVSLAEHMAVEIAPTGRIQAPSGHDDCVMGRGIRLIVREGLAPVALDVARNQNAPDLQERLRRWRKDSIEEARQRAQDEADGAYYDDVLGVVR